MRIRLKLFATFREIVGEGEIMKEVGTGATVGDLVTELVTEYPRLGKFKESMICSVNKEYANFHKELNEGDEVGILPPVTGG